MTRDNAGRITSQGGNGATARGGRLRTASGKQRAVQTARIKGARPGTVKGGGSLAPSKELAKMQRQIKKWEKQQFEPPSAKNNFSSPGGAARAALANVLPKYRRLLGKAKDDGLRARMVVSKNNKAFERDRAIKTGALSGQRVTFRSTAGARARYTGRAQQVLSTRTYGAVKRGRGLRRTTIGEQFSLFGRSKPIKSGRRTASNFNPTSYTLRRRAGRTRLANR